MTYTVKPSEIYSSKEAVGRALMSNNLRIIGFRLVRPGESYLQVPNADYRTDCQPMFKIIRFVVAPKIDTVPKKWWE